MFRYINDLYRTEEQTEFEFAEISMFLTGNEDTMGKVAIGKLLHRINQSLSEIHAPFSLKQCKEKVCIISKKGNDFVSKKGNE